MSIAKAQEARRQQFADRCADLRMCGGCENEMAAEAFFFSGKWREFCQPCHRERDAARAKARYQANRVEAAVAVRMKRYGLTREQHDALMEITTCSICNESDQEMHIDHDHQTGKVRGRICGLCNRALGLFKDDPSRMRAAAAYIESHRSIK